MALYHDSYSPLSRQSGVLLLEALIAILIFSIGILAIVGLQAVSIKLVGDGKYRSDAGFLAEEMIANMWASDKVPANMSARFGTGATACTAAAAGLADAAAPCAACTADPASAACTSYVTYQTWSANVNGALPDTVANPPTVVVDTSTGSTTGMATVTVRWRAPNDQAVRSHAVTAQIR